MTLMLIILLSYPSRVDTVLWYQEINLEYRPVASRVSGDDARSISIQVICLCLGFMYQLPAPDLIPGIGN